MLHSLSERRHLGNCGQATGTIWLNGRGAQLLHSLLRNSSAKHYFPRSKLVYSVHAIKDQTKHQMRWLPADCLKRSTSEQHDKCGTPPDWLSHDAPEANSSVCQKVTTRSLKHTQKHISAFSALYHTAGVCAQTYTHAHPCVQNEISSTCILVFFKLIQCPLFPGNREAIWAAQAGRWGLQAIMSTSWK